MSSYHVPKKTVEFHCEVSICEACFEVLVDFHRGCRSHTSKSWVSYLRNLFYA